MIFKLIKKQLPIAVGALAFFALGQAANAATAADERIYNPDPWFKDLVAASKKGKKELCDSGKFFRKNTGNDCKDFTKGVIAVFACGEVPGFLDSDCGKKVQFKSSDSQLNALVTNASPKKEEYNQEAFNIMKKALMTPIVEPKKGEIYFRNTKWLVCVSEAENMQALRILTADTDVRRKCDEFKNYMLTAAPKQGVPAGQQGMAKAEMLTAIQADTAALVKIEASAKSAGKADLLKAAQDMNDALKNLNKAVAAAPESAVPAQKVATVKQLQDNLNKAKSDTEKRSTLELSKAEIQAIIDEMRAAKK